MSKNILRFENFVNGFSVNESETSSKAVSELLSNFLKLYMYLDMNNPIVLTGKTAEETSNQKMKEQIDLFSKISQEKDNNKRAQIIKDSIDGKSENLTSSFSSIKGDVNQVATQMYDLFIYATTNDSAKAKEAEIEKTIQDTIKNIQDRIKLAFKQTGVVESRRKNILTYENFNYRILQEKRSPKSVMGEERNSMILQIEPVYTEMMMQQKTPATPNMKTKADESITKFNEILSLLKNDEAWDKMRRKERKTKIQETGKKIEEIISGIGEFRKKELSNISMDKKTSDDILAVINGVNSIINKINKIQTERNIKAAEESAKEYKVGDTIKYLDKEGDSQEGVIVKIEGTSVIIKRKDGKEVSKKVNDIEGKIEKKEEDKNKVDFKIDKTIKATGRRPRGKNKEISKKVFEIICNKYKNVESYTKMKEWGKSKFCSVSSYVIGPNRSAVIKAIKKEYGLDNKNADLTPEFVQKLAS